MAERCLHTEVGKQLRTFVENLAVIDRSMPKKFKKKVKFVCSLGAGFPLRLALARIPELSISGAIASANRYFRMVK